MKSLLCVNIKIFEESFPIFNHTVTHYNLKFSNFERNHYLIRSNNFFTLFCVHSFKVRTQNLLASSYFINVIVHSIQNLSCRKRLQKNNNNNTIAIHMQLFDYCYNIFYILLYNLMIALNLIKKITLIFDHQT